MDELEKKKLYATLDLANEKIKPMIKKIADFYGVEIGYDINWIIKDSKDGIDEQKP